MIVTEKSSRLCFNAELDLLDPLDLRTYFVNCLVDPVQNDTDLPDLIFSNLVFLLFIRYVKS